MVHLLCRAAAHGTFVMFPYHGLLPLVMGQRSGRGTPNKGPALKQVDPVVQSLLLPPVRDTPALALVNKS